MSAQVTWEARVLCDVLHRWRAKCTTHVGA
jgi:hypothetical protein